MTNLAIDTTTEFPLLYREDNGGIAKLTLNRPDQYNPLSQDMLSMLQNTFDELADDETVKVIILAANGKAFCAGHDLKEVQASESKMVNEILQQCNRMMLSMTRLPQPVIAQVQGIATAAGCQLVANCDLAVASDKAKFAVSGINLGLFCSTPSVALSRNVSRKHSFEMLFTGDFIDAEAAVEKGLVNKAVKPNNLEAETTAMAQKIAEKPREVLALGKQLFYQQIDQEVESAYKNASDTMTCNMTLSSTTEGINAFIEKRKPNWS